MSRASIPPSRAARAAAAREWPDVQAQYKLATGVFGFSCAGHGGLVAVVGVADLPDEAVAQARELGKVEFIVFDLRRVYYTAGNGGSSSKAAPVYKQDSLRQWAASRPELPAFEVWVGEEDCDWACIVAANDAIREGGIRARYFSDTLTREDVLGCLERWNAEFLPVAA